MGKTVSVAVVLLFVVLALIAMAGCGGTTASSTTNQGGSSGATNPAPAKAVDFFYVASNSFRSNPGTITGFALHHDGSLTPAPNSTETVPNLSNIKGDPLGRTLYATALFQLLTYGVNSDGSLTPRTPVASTPANWGYSTVMAIDAKGQNLYTDMLDGSGEFATYDYALDANGNPGLQDSVPKLSSQMAITPDGTAAYIAWSIVPKIGAEVDIYRRSTNDALTFWYSVNAPPDPSSGFSKLIASFAMDPLGHYALGAWNGIDGGQAAVVDEIDLYPIAANKSLGTPIVFGTTPTVSSAIFDPTGNWVLVATSTGILTLKFDRAAGSLAASGITTATVAFDNLALSTDGQYLVAVSSATNAVYAYKFASGTLTQLSGFPQTVDRPSWVTVVHPQ